MGFCKFYGGTPIGSPALYCAFASGALGLPSEVPPLAIASNTSSIHFPRKLACKLSLLLFYWAFASSTAGLPSEVPPFIVLLQVVRWDSHRKSRPLQQQAIHPVSISPASLLVCCLFCSFIVLLQVLRWDSHRKSRPLFRPLFTLYPPLYPPFVLPLRSSSAISHPLIPHILLIYVCARGLRAHACTYIYII